MNVKVLFLIRRKQGYGSPVPSKGLFNSAQFVVNALRRVAIDAELVEVVDGNSIDREVTRVRPSHCILEALWVTPTKVAELRRRHPSCKFVVRIHSNIPFLANDGMAIDWLGEYNSRVGCNTLQAVNALQPLLKRSPVYLPNIYEPGVAAHPKKITRGPNVWVGCMGAIRPLKNQLLQAMAAIVYAEDTNRRLYFHINSRVEQGGEQVLRNIRALFRNEKTKRHVLVDHGWIKSHKEVRAIIASFDLSLQVSFTETFNIVSADAVWLGVPIVVSKEIEWAPPRAKVRSNTIPEVVEAMRREERRGERGASRNLNALVHHNEKALDAWKGFLTRKEHK